MELSVYIEICGLQEKSMQGVFGLAPFWHSSVRCSCWLCDSMHTHHIRPGRTELGGRIGLACCVAVWEVCFFLKPSRKGLHQEVQAGRGGGLSLLPRAVGLVVGQRTGQVSRSSSLPVLVGPAGALQGNSDPG